MAKVTFRDFGLRKQLNKAAFGLLRKSITKKVKLRAQQAEANMVRSVRAGGRSGLHFRTGQLARSLSSKVVQGQRSVQVSIGTIKRTRALAYAGIHEFGGTIKAKPGHYLWIPLDANKTPAGNTRFSPTEARNDFFTTFIAKSRAGNKIFSGESTKDFVDDPIPLFVLKKQVKIPARPFVAPEFNKMQKGLEFDLRHILFGVLDRTP